MSVIKCRQKDFSRFILQHLVNVAQSPQKHSWLCIIAFIVTEKRQGDIRE